MGNREEPWALVTSCAWLRVMSVTDVNVDVDVCVHARCVCVVVVGVCGCARERDWCARLKRVRGEGCLR